MITRITQSQFQHAFNEANRGENFTWAGREALYEWFEEMHDDCGGEEVELDVIAICCEFSEYGDLEELAKDYNVDGLEDVDTDEREWHIRDWLNDRTQLIEFAGGVIVQCF